MKSNGKMNLYHAQHIRQHEEENGLVLDVSDLTNALEIPIFIQENPKEPASKAYRNSYRLKIHAKPHELMCKHTHHTSKLKRIPNIKKENRRTRKGNGSFHLSVTRFF